MAPLGSLPGEWTEGRGTSSLSLQWVNKKLVMTLGMFSHNTNVDQFLSAAWWSRRRHESNLNINGIRPVSL